MNIKTRFLLLITLLLLSFSSFTNVITSKTTPSQIDSLNEKAYKTMRFDPAKAIVMLADIERASIQLNYKKGLAINYLYQAELYGQRGFYKRATILYYQSMELCRQENDIYNIARAQEQISSIKRRNGDFAGADKLLNSSLLIFKKLNKTIDLVNVELRLGINKQKQKKYEEAFKLFNDAHEVSKRSGYIYGLKKTYFNTADLYNTLNKLDSAAFYYHKALQIDTVTKDGFGKSLSYLGLADIYLKNNQLNKAVSYSKIAYKYADSLHVESLTDSSITILLDAYNRIKNKDSIIYWQQKLVKMERRVSETDRRDAIAFIEVLKQQQAKQLAIQKQVLDIQKVSQTKSILIICFLVVILISVLLTFPISYNYRKAKAYAMQLNEKNKLIEQHAESVAILNEKILGQNMILEEDNNLKNKLLSVISHDLRHPLTNTKSIVDLINMKLVSKEEAEPLFAHLEGQYTRALTLLDNLLYWMKSQIHGDLIKKEEINLHELVESLIDEQKLAFQKKEIEVINEIDAAIEICTERELIKIVFRNLLTNAIKFTQQNGLISFTSSRENNITNIAVIDNGTGMNAEVLRRVRQESNYTSRGTANEEGSGLGLMLIRDLIRKINGKLTIDSEPEVGSTFTISFTGLDAPCQQ